MLVLFKKGSNTLIREDSFYLLSETKINYWFKHLLNLIN